MRAILPATMLLALAPGVAAQVADPVESFLLGLPRDATQLLSLAAPAVPPASRRETQVQTIVCEPQELSGSQLEDSFAILSADTNRIYPGAILVVDQRLAQGRPTVTSYPRPPLALNISLPGLGADARFLVQQPSAGTVHAAVDGVVSAWLSGPAGRGYQAPAIVSYRRTRSYNAQQAAAGLGFSAQWAGGRASAMLSASSDQSRATYLAVFRQVFYTVGVDRPRNVAGFFRRDVGLARLRSDFGPARLPGYVSSVAYGRLILVSMETEASVSEADAKAALDYATGGTGAEGQVNAHARRVANNSRFGVIVLGGGAEHAARVVAHGPDNDRQVKDIIESGSQLARDNPGLPIGYTVNLLTGELAHARYDGPFAVPSCRTLDNYAIELRHDGGYRGRFIVRWQQPRGVGEETEDRSWHSGVQTAGWRRTISVPADALGLTVLGELDFFHNDWRQAGYWNEVSRRRAGTCLRIAGTTVQPQSGTC